MSKSKTKPKNADKPKNTVERHECGLCYEQIEKEEDCLKCEGACESVIHRYCAGVTKWHLDKINSGQVAFVCQYCELSLAKTVYQQLQFELQVLKVELANIK